MLNKKNLSLRSSNVLVLGTLLVLSVIVAGCSKNDESSDGCRNLFAARCLLSQSAGNGTTLAQTNATTNDGASTTAATLSTTSDEVTTQATDSDEDSLVYKVLDRLPGSVDVNSDGTFTYTPSADFARAEALGDSFSVTVSDNPRFHQHGLGDLLGLFPQRHQDWEAPNSMATSVP